MKTLFSLLIIFSFLFVTGCQPDASMPILDLLPTFTSAISLSQSSEYTEGIDMSDLTTNPDPNAQKMVQLAKESLARKFKINEDQINLFSVEAMNWPDASLGCPQAGNVYAQVITPGFQILFEAIGESYSYHSDNIDRVVLCQIHPPDNIFPTPE